MVSKRKSPVSAQDAAAEEAAEGLGIYRMLFESAGVGLFESTPGGRFVRANKRMAEILGYASAEELIENVQDIARTHYMSMEQREAFVEKVVNEDGVDRHLMEARRRDGSHLWLRVSAIAIRDKQSGDIACYVGTSEDVTDLIETQEELRQQKADYERLFNNAAEGIYRSSPDGKQLGSNPALARLNGYETVEEHLQGVQDIATEWYVEPDGREKFKTMIEGEGRVINMEAEIYRHKSRERAWIRENSWVVRDDDGNIRYYEGTISDVTEEKRAKAALELSEARQRDYAETSSDWFWETDPDHRFSFVSANARRFGVNSESAIGKSRVEWARRLDLDRADIEGLRENQAMMERQEPFRNFVYRIPLANGSFEYANISGRPHYDKEGAFLGYRGTCRIVTEEIRAANDLRAARKAAEDASVAKSRFLANMSHELRTPLNAIIGFADMMKMETFGPIGHPRYTEYLGDIGVSANMLLSLIEDVLDISKAEAGRLDLDESVFDLCAEIDTVGQIMAPVAERRRIRLAIELPKGLHTVRADLKRIRQIAINLVTNAVKFSPTGSTVRLGVKQEGKGLSFYVADEGDGMTEHEIFRALRPFEQLTDSRELANEGAGLGLPLCKELAARHDAELELQSTPGAGTTAFVRFPAARCGHDLPKPLESTALRVVS